MGVCSELFQRIDGLEEEYLDFLVDICRIESPSEHKPGVDAVAEYFVEKARARGWKTEVLEQPVSGNAVCITMNPDVQAQSVVFSGHMDTVHPVGFFGETPVTTDDEKMYGPGVADCKGGLAAAFCAMAALEDLGFRARPVKLILQSDEEVGSRFSNKETVRFMAEKAKDCVAFLNCEPHTPGKATIARKGICRYEFEVTGKAAHGSHCYNGVSAIREAAYKIIALEALKDRSGVTCNCGLIQGGTAVNTVPDRCVFSVDVRFLNRQQEQEAEAFMQQIAQKAFVEGSSCKLTRLSRRCTMERTERNEALLEKLNAIYAQEGLTQLTGVQSNGGSDAADMTGYGIPCLDSFGIHGGPIHSRDEWAYLHGLSLSAKYLASAAYCL